MAKLPTRQDLGTLPALPPNRGAGLARIRQRAPDASAIGRGVQDFARGIGAVGAAAAEIGQHRKKADEFDTEMRFQEFKWAQEQQLDERMRSIQPGQARDFATNWQKDYTQGSAKSFFETVPEPLKAEYERKLFAVERNLYGSAATFGRTEQKRVSTNELASLKDNAYSSRARTTPTDELDSVTNEWKRAVESNPDLSPIEKDELVRKGMKDLAKAHVNAMTPAQIERAFAGKSSILDRIIGVESGGRADAKNPNSSATGAGQFIESTWLDMVQRHRPELMRGKSRAEVLALRNDPALSREMVGAYMAENATTLKAAGLPTTSGNLYLAHFLGPAGAVRLLSANPDAAVERILPGNVISANRSILAGKSVSDVMRWAEGKMSGAVPEAFTYLDDAEKQKALKGIEDYLKEQARAEEIFAGRSAADPDDPDDRKAIDAVVSNTDLNQRITSMDPGASDMLTRVVDTTTVLPDSTLSTLRGMAANGSPEERQYALQTASRLLRQKPASLDRRGASELRNDARKFEGYVLGGGLDPAEAIKRLDETKTEAFKAREQALKTQANEAAKQLKPEIITEMFDGFFTSEPELGATRIRGAIMFDAFKENYKFHFTQTGDEEVAKHMALEDVKRSYDVSSVTGNNRLMKHPPEKYYPALDGGYDYFTKQLQADVSERAGRELPLDNIYIEAVPQTDADIRMNRLPRYGISWKTEDGKLDTVPNMVWRPDFKAAKDRATSRARKRFNDLREQTKEIQLMNFMGGELAIPETEGAPAELVQQRKDERQMSLLDALETGGLA